MRVAKRIEHHQKNVFSRLRFSNSDSEKVYREGLFTKIEDHDMFWSLPCLEHIFQRPPDGVYGQVYS